MPITKDEDDMKLSELMKAVLKWAKSHGEPFTSAVAFEAIKDADDAKAVSDALGNLYRAGQLARKKIDKVRFSYALLESAPDGYESLKDPQPPQVSAEAAKLIENLPLRKAPVPVIEEKPIDASTEIVLSKTALSIEETKPAITAVPDRIIKEEQEPAVSVSVAASEEIKPFQLPDSFTLTLQTANGLIITIQSGASCN